MTFFWCVYQETRRQVHHSPHGGLYHVYLCLGRPCQDACLFILRGSLERSFRDIWLFYSPFPLCCDRPCATGFGCRAFWSP